ncbi:hypothetical protein AB4Z34_36270, partial [Ensifer sp. 2YAB10]
EQEAARERQREQEAARERQQEQQRQQQEAQERQRKLQETERQHAGGQERRRLELEAKERQRELTQERPNPKQPSVGQGSPLPTVQSRLPQQQQGAQTVPITPTQPTSQALPTNIVQPPQQRPLGQGSPLPTVQSQLPQQQRSAQTIPIIPTAQPVSQSLQINSTQTPQQRPLDQGSPLPTTQSQLLQQQRSARTIPITPTQPTNQTLAANITQTPPISNTKRQLDTLSSSTSAEETKKQNYLLAVTQSLKLGARHCPDGEGKHYLVGILPKIKPREVECIDVHYTATCPGSRAGTSGVIKTFMGESTDCFFGDAAEIAPTPACKPGEVQVQVSRVTGCGG